jgi:DNA-binding Lrp family transcriptional regulator
MPVAYVMVNTVPNKMEEVLAEVKKIDGVVDAYMVYGVYDIIAEVKVENVVELRETILSIRILENILATLTLRVVR